MPVKEELKKAIELRSNDKPTEALKIITSLLKKHPNNPDINYQAAWTCDYMGLEKEAAPFYEKAIEFGLSGEDLQGAYLGLGATYRSLGEYEMSLAVFELGMAEFPEDRSIKTFRALTLYNLGQYKESVSELLVQLLDTTADKQIKSYEQALRFYSDKLDQKWK